MMGHTQKDTINQRRPLTANMLRVLESVKSRTDQLHPCLFHGEMSQQEKNAARALLDRRMLDWDNALRGYFLTDLGRASLTAGERNG